MSTRIIRTRKTVHSGIKTSAATVLAANPARCSYKINNLSTNALFVKEGESASTTDFTYILAGGTGADNGTGASYDSPNGQVYTGPISVAGTSPRCNVIERTEQDNASN